MFPLTVSRPHVTPMCPLCDTCGPAEHRVECAARISRGSFKPLSLAAPLATRLLSTVVTSRFGTTTDITRNGYDTLTSRSSGRARARGLSPGAAQACQAGA
jgi:hypothetical protein